MVGRSAALAPLLRPRTVPSHEGQPDGRRRIRTVDHRMGVDLAVPLRGERNAVRHNSPHLWLARVGIAISILPVVIFTGIVLYA